MNQKTMTRADLCEIVYRRIGLSRSDSADLIEAVLQEITESLEEGDSVKLSTFGTFFIREKKERVGRNPKTGVEAPIAGRRVVSFRASKVLKAYLNDAESSPSES